MYAKIAATYIRAFCKASFKDSDSMESTVAIGEMIDVFDHNGGGTHKYIPADKLSADLEQPAGAGVYGYWVMKDGSYLLRTCCGRLAYWSGKAEDKAAFPTDRAELI